MIIIKSLSRKTASHSQLLKYINKGRVEGDEFCLKHNIYSNTHYKIVREFLKNHDCLKKRKNSNALYHEIISIKHQKEYSKEELKNILLDIAEQYIEIRAKDCLVYGVIHENKQGIHLHLAISSNELYSTKNHYFSKQDFRNIQKKINEYAYKKYPKLELIEEKEKKDKAKSKSKDSEVHIKKRTGKPSQKEVIRETLKDIFATCKNVDEFNIRIREANLYMYHRGKNLGFEDLATNRRYRLANLGLEDEFEALNNRFSTPSDKQEPFQKQTDDNAKTRFKEQQQKIRDEKIESQAKENAFREKMEKSRDRKLSKTKRFEKER